MATLLNWSDDPLNRKRKNPSNPIGLLGQAFSVPQKRTASQPAPAISNQATYTLTRQSPDSNISTLQARNAFNNSAPLNLSSITRQRQRQQNKQDDWFKQVSDSQKLRQIYDEEFDKAKKQNNIFQNLLDNGQTTARAKTNAINRYNQDLLKRAYDDQGKIVDQNAYNELKGGSIDLGKQTALAGNAQARAMTKKIGADDKDQSLGERLYNTLETATSMDIPGAVLGADDATKFSARDVAGFVGNLPAGMFTAPISGVRNAGRAISGQGRNAETGEMEQLSGLQRLGAGVSSGVDLVSPFIGGSGTLLGSLANSGAKQAGKQVAKSGAKEFIKQLAKEATQEAGEEAFQSLAEELNENGKWDEGTLGRTAEAAALGALGSGLMTTAGTAINAGKAKLNQQNGLRGLIKDAKNNLQNSNNGIATKVDNAYSNIVNKGAIERLAKGIEQGTDGNIRFARMSKNVFDDINKVRTAQGLEPLTKRQVTAYQNAVNNHLSKRVNEGMSARNVAQMAFNSLTSQNAKGIPGYYQNQLAVSSPGMVNDYDSTALGLAQDGGTSIKSIAPRDKNQVAALIANGQQKSGPNGRSGSPLAANQTGGVGSPALDNNVNPLGTRNSIISQTPTDVNTQNQLNAYYKQYGNDFYDKLPESLQSRYEALLDTQPRDQQGRYIDPITGERWIDESVSKVDDTDPIFYHGTPNGGFDKFHDGSYFTDNRDYADRYQNPLASDLSYGKDAGNPMTYQVKLHNKAPFDISNDIARRIYIDDYIKGGNAMSINPYEPQSFYDNIKTIDWTEAEELKNFLIENGYNYDSIVADEGGDLDESGNPVPRGKSVLMFNGDDVEILSDNTQKNSTNNAQKEIDAYYKKYGSDFYDHLPNKLQEAYDKILDNAPRNKDGSYTDPITGEKWIDQPYNESESTDRLNNLLDGKMSYADYSKFQSERLWEAFQDSNGGTETFLKGLNSYNGDGNRADVSRHTVSNNGTLYRQLYDEAGRKPSHKMFNEALEDVLTNGEKSKYYDAFKEFDPDLALYNSGSDDIDTLIDAREYAESDEYKSMQPKNGTRQTQQTSREASIRQQAKSSLEVIADIMSGKNILQSALAGANGRFYQDSNKFNNTRTNMTIERGSAPDGSDLVKIDNKVFDGVPNNSKAKSKALREYIQKNFQGKKMPLNYGKDGEAVITRQGKNKVSMTGDISTRGRVIGNLDEILQVSKVDPNEPVRQDSKNHGIAKDGFEYRQSYVDVDGEVYKVRSNIGLDGDKKTFYTLNKYNEDIKNPPVPIRNSSSKSSGGDSGISVSQSNEDVNTKNTSDMVRHTRSISTPNIAQDNSNVNSRNLQKYVNDQVKAQKAENKTPIKQKAQDTIDNLKHYLVDDAVAYERYVKDKGDRLNLREGIDRVRTSDTIAKQMIEDSGLAETIGKMKTAEADEFQQYLIAKRSQELKRTKGEDFRTGRNDVADKALIQAVGNKYAIQEKVVRDFNKKMLDYAVDTGLISSDLRNQLVKDNTDYVPMNRVLDDVAGMGIHKSKQLANLSKQSTVQKIKGSDRIVQNPLESMIRNAIRTVNEGERNLVAKQLSETAAFREAKLPEGVKPKPGNDKLSFIIDGEKVSYEVPALVAKEMKNLNGVMPDFANNVLKVLGAPTKVLRTGATGANPMFAASNLIRDQLQTTITGNLKANLKGTPKALKATFGIGKEGKAMQAELARNGIIGSEYRQTYGYKSGELVKELQQAHQLPKQAIERLKHPIDTLADVIGKTEYFTRAQQYFGTDGTVAEKSQAARNNTLNFGRAGATVRVLNKVIPFLNAGVQGGRITVNQFKERPVRTTMAVATFAGVAAAVRGMNSAQNQELWDRIGDEEKQSNLIIFGDDAHYDPETNRVVGVFKIPLPQMVYPITDAVNNLKGKSEDLLMLGGDIFTAVTGIDANNPVNQLLPTAIKPFVETAMNKNTYTGQEIVSDYDSNLNPEDKGKKYTTGAARSIAKVTGIDAPVIDNFIQNWGGGLFKDLTKVMTDNPDNKSDGGGVGTMIGTGAFRRFMSASVESQYDIQATLAKDYKNQLKSDPAFQALDANEQKKALDQIDTDTRAIAGFAAKTEQGRTNEITNDLSKRQKELMQNGFSVSNYNQPNKNKGSNRSIEVSDTLNAEHRKVLDEYSVMEKEDWEKYIYSTAGREAEYKLAAAKLENDKANGKLTDVQALKREKEVRKLKVSQLWDKNVRDIYSLAGSRTDMQSILNEVDNRDDMVGYLNALNRAMYESGVITASTYKSRNRNINNLGSSNGSKKQKSAYSAASKAALSAYTKSLAGGNEIKVNSSKRAPSTSHRMNTVAIATGIKKAQLGAQAKVSVRKGIK